MPLTTNELRAARTTPTTAYHDFLLHFPRSPLRIHAFFEGKDDASFYSHLIEQLIPPGYILHVYRCGNRDMVIETMRKIDLHLTTNDRHRALFFLDKDLTDIIPEQDLARNASNCYVTDVYSIENFIISTAMLKKICVELLHFLDDDRLIRVLSEFDVLLSRFHRMLLPLMAYVVVLRRNGYRPQLEDINLTRYLLVTNDFRIERRAFDLLALLEGTCRAPRDLRLKILATARELVSLSPKAWIRGKYERWFFLEFTNRIIAAYEQAGDPATIHTTISNRNFVEVLGPRTSMPTGLKEFLATNFGLCPPAQSA